ncbi:hypothetical protein U5U50_03105 [Mycoplasma sp. 888]|uniref:hypothetical protein n=1 Tax=Mycoplasma sp. 888 TaxID=3108483 RepID=UPI002D77F678|nr:hypothetical protein [Mycoplasma sp. 888]WRQ25769.1 hypothetical protein U5U50_03105 [Mycoplasma sp. 888]
MSHQQIIYVDFTESHKNDLLRICEDGIKNLSDYSVKTQNSNLKAVLEDKINSITEIV